MQLMMDKQQPRKHSYETKGMTFEISKAATHTKYCLVLGHTPSKVSPIPFPSTPSSSFAQMISASPSYLIIIISFKAMSLDIPAMECVRNWEQI